MPSLANVSPTRPEADEVEVVEDEPDLHAVAGRFELLAASPGFVPDPMTREATTSGGTVELNEYDERCQGYAASAPDVVIQAARPFAELSIMAASETDLTLMVVGPDGEPRCADDVDELLPVVRGEFAAGLHRVWVGTASQGIVAPFTLGLSEYDDSLPSALLR